MHMYFRYQFRCLRGATDSEDVTNFARTDHWDFGRAGRDLILADLTEIAGTALSWPEQRRRTGL